MNGIFNTDDGIYFTMLYWFIFWSLGLLVPLFIVLCSVGLGAEEGIRLAEAFPHRAGFLFWTRFTCVVVSNVCPLAFLMIALQSFMSWMWGQEPFYPSALALIALLA